ncbi:alpha-galactosidase [Mediterraneibacter agrestimuris]|uniref:alpha-galactosidase n=1 Tax=Mediterraneibacter agrestimuris TaxID=2941333 RepID=UPI00203B82AF|nr:alpha-galactosidase [Mediterraneibacter agrestimuris]
MELITLHTRNTTYQMGIDEMGFLLHLYYGPKAEGDMSFLLTYADRGFSGNPYDAGENRTISMDVFPLEYPCCGNGDFRSAAFNVRDKQGVFGVDLRFQQYSTKPGKYNIPGLPAVYTDEKEAYTMEIILTDERLSLEVVLRYGVLPELDVITRSVIVRNQGNETVFINKVYSACIDFLGGNHELLHFYGRHTMERNLERIPVIHGKQQFGSRRGMSSHQHNPFFILAGEETTEDYGSCYGMAFLYSGNFSFEAEKDQYHQTRIQIGLLDEMFDYSLDPGETFYSPEAVLAYSSKGLTALSHIYHELIQEHVCRGKYKHAARPVLINSWEAAYMDFDGDKIIDIARKAAKLGIDMVVLDDGWFGNRDTDQSGLGDWKVNEKKLGGSLSRIADAVNELNMKFGLWIEPEMVNEDSELYRKHPDWAFVIPGRLPVRGRSQLVLDFSRKEVVDYIYDNIVKVISSANIEYIKMDMNRSICDVFTITEGYQNYGKIMHEYVLGVYDFLERLNQNFPDILIEGCSGGGGRFDMGMLYYTPQIWCSDDTDAIERIRIQHGTSFCYPPGTMASHVSAAPNHQTGRTVEFKTRGVVAMAGSFGYELDLNLLTDQEEREVKEQIRTYKRDEKLVRGGDYYRLHTPGKDVEAAAWSFVSKKKDEALLNIVTLDTHGNEPTNYVRMKGLEPHIMYYCKETNKCYSGAVLMHVGYPVPLVMGEYKAWQFHFDAENA